MTHRQLLVSTIGLGLLLVSCSDSSSRGVVLPASSAVAPATSASAPAAPAAAAPTQCLVHPTTITPPSAQASLQGPPSDTCYRLGSFVVHWRGSAPATLTVTHQSQAAQAVWTNVPGEAFLLAEQGRETILRADSAGFFSVKDQSLWATS
jgi:hypothetical protein